MKFRVTIFYLEAPKLLSKHDVKFNQETLQCVRNSNENLNTLLPDICTMQFQKYFTI